MSSKKKILHLIQSLGNGGCENMLLRTLPLLTDEFEHHVITLRELGELAPRFAENGIPVTTVHWNSFFDIPGYRRLLSEIRQFAPDTVITYLFHADMLGRLYVQKNVSAPVIPFLRTTYNHPRYRIARLFEWLTKPLVRHYLANSEAVRDFYVRHIGVAAEKITVIPNGIDTEYFDHLAPNPELRESLNVALDDFVIICVANLHLNKGHRYLLEAFELIYAEYSQAKLLLLGDGEERKDIESMIQCLYSKESILLLGKRSDVPALLKLSHLFVLPTLFEGQSNAILESMAASVPVITTNIPENQSIIRDSVTGILVPKKDSIAIANAMQRLLSNTTLRKSLADMAHNTIRNHYGLSSIRKSWIAFLRTL
ncbi:MAG: glycosyltransferase [Candidatus Moraniibacteriota bacterium]